MKRLFATLAVGLLLAGAVLAQSPRELGWIDLELAGPLTSVRLSSGDGETTARVALEAGERRTLAVPFLAGAGRDLGGPRVDEVRAPAGVTPGVARLLEGTRRDPSPWEGLPFGLRRRPAPTVAPVVATPGAARLLCVVVALLLVVGARRRPVWALACGAVAAGSIWLLPAPERESATVRVLEGDLASAVGLEVRGGIETLELPWTAPGWVRCTPQGSAVTILGEEREGVVRWSVLAPGARPYLVRRIEAPESRLEGFAFPRFWVRDPDGGWRFRSGWAPRDGLGFEGAADAPPPPGWLCSALPQGILVQIGEGVDPRGETVWFRAF